ncbi:ubiquitin thioesterase OTUB2 isoform X3 [Microtus oregoni]|uniref:ubiquitin thioesterase OTUB2 isoform X3 n=1 Tax=Microtus oregoni TaxID=111838 RepID=UPI001BB29818|nr:ubiquitin thioesterase OTUB2 isoform X3 [Microtus oregoni]
MGTASTGPWAIPTWSLCWARAERSSSLKSVCYKLQMTSWLPALRNTSSETPLTLVKFYSVVELVEKDSSVSSLLKVFNDQSSSDQIVQFLRLLTSAFIRNRADFFRHFIDEEMDIKDFCTHEVEPMAMECDHVQITALSQALNIALQVEYVDEMDTALNHHVFPEAAIPSVYLLYKTSHYNILYAAEKH